MSNQTSHRSVTRRRMLGLSVGATVGLVHQLARFALPFQSAAADESVRERPWPHFNGRDLTGWKIVSQDFYDKHGKVAWRDGAVHLEEGRPGTAIAWTGAMPKIDYEVSLEAKRVAGDDFFCGMTFPIADAFCTLIVGGWGGGTTGLSNIDGFAAVENETTDYVDAKRDRWYRIRLRVARRQIQAWVDDRKIVNVDSEGKKFEIWWEQEPVRPFGIASWNTTAALRNLKVAAL